MTRAAEVVVITGASAGMGRATARAFAKRKAHIGLLARDRVRLEATAREVEELGGRAIAIPTDVSAADQVEAAAVAVEKAFGAIDVWVNNAMVSVFAPVTEIPPAEFRRVMDVTFLGCVHGTQAALRRMLPRDRGAIVQVGSALAYRGIPLQAPYCAAKHAMQGFCDSLWAELLHAGSHVHLTMVQLPALNTPQFDWVRSRLPRKAQPVPPIYQPEVAAEAIVWAAHHHRREVYVGWPTVKAIVGDRVAPRLLDRWLGKTAFQSQQTRQPEDPERPDNLWNPVAGDPGARGRFDRRAHSGSSEFWLATHRGAVTVLAGVLAATAAVAFRRTTQIERAPSSEMVQPVLVKGRMRCAERMEVWPRIW